jgi:UDP-glucose 6-dehydrogenase
MEDEVDTVLKAIGSDDRIGRKYLGFGFGFGGPCFPRDNRAFSAYTQQVGVYNSIGETTDNFNNEHSEFLRDYYLNKNPDELPYCFKYLTYKPGIDILTESRPYDLALALLEEGYKVYCIDDTVKGQVDERIIFDPAPIEPCCYVDL